MGLLVSYEENELCIRRHDTQHNDKYIATLSTMALDAECCYADCHSAEWYL
jgi:hypothetical protein